MTVRGRDPHHRRIVTLGEFGEHRIVASPKSLELSALVHAAEEGGSSSRRRNRERTDTG